LRLRDPGARQLASDSPAHKPVIAATAQLERRFEANSNQTRRWYARLVKELRDLLYGDDIGESPWEQHRPGGPRDNRHMRDVHAEFASSLENADFPYEAAREKLGFDRPAIRVESSEGTQERFAWSLSLAEEFFARLEASPGRSSVREPVQRVIPDDADVRPEQPEVEESPRPDDSLL
jgi:hypothetical protein